MLFVSLPGKEFNNGLAAEYIPSPQHCWGHPRLWAVYFTLGTFSFVICKTQASRGVNDRAQSVSTEPTVGGRCSVIYLHISCHGDVSGQSR